MLTLCRWAIGGEEALAREKSVADVKTGRSGAQGAVALAGFPGLPLRSSTRAQSVPPRFPNDGAGVPGLSDTCV